MSELQRACAVIALLLTGACTFQPSPRGQGEEQSEAPEPEAEIVAMLTASARSWNAGDLEAFLDDYTSSPDLTFVGSSGVQRGLDEVRARYERTYWAPGAERDSLRFEELEARSLGDEHALALGRYVLYRPAQEDSVTAAGRFSLVLRKEGDEWKIIHDHSSEGQ